MEQFTEELKTLLSSRGADLVGIGDMRGVETCTFKTGVSVAIALPKDIILDLQEAPTREYYELYHSLNNRLNQIVLAGEEFLQHRGYQAYAQTTDRISVSQDFISMLPHKTVATRGGLGWIGKNCLLVTPQYGSAVRISSLLTDAPLVYDEPVNQSRCGTCSQCVSRCPAKALHNFLWTTDTPRKKIVDVKSCYQKQIEIMSACTGIETDLCGKCFAVCTYTRKYLQGRTSSD